MPVERVEVTVPARLHLGFLDLHGGLGRLYGSLGLTLDAPRTGLVLERRAGTGRDVTGTGPDSERAVAHLQQLSERLGVADGLHITLTEAIPPHAGLGSGTQLALATGMALNRLQGGGLSVQEVARSLGRGARSGIGIGAFEQGGLLLDGGRGAADGVPPILSRLPIPEDWRFLLVFDPQRQGLHGGDESAAFDGLPAFPADKAAALCRLLLMRILPAAAERDIERFGAGVTELQAAVGDHFAAAQGDRFTSPRVAEALAWLAAEGAAGVGQSSWGPTGFAILPSQAAGQRLLDLARARGAETDDQPLTFALVPGRNRGAVTSDGSAADVA